MNITTLQPWKVVTFNECPGIVHVAPCADTYEHIIEVGQQCWCGAWHETVEGGVIIHHLNLTERLAK